MEGKMNKYFCYHNGEKIYTHAASLSQAAMFLGHKLNTFISDVQVKEVKNDFFVYTFSYKTDPIGQVNLVEVVAKDLETAADVIKSKPGKVYDLCLEEKPRQASVSEEARAYKINFLCSLM
jgi:hypothetical protein